MLSDIRSTQAVKAIAKRTETDSDRECSAYSDESKSDTDSIRCQNLKVFSVG